MINIWEHIATFFSVENYTLFVVALGSGILCFAAGVVGTFTYLRKRALIGDVISHSVLPGVAIAFMLTGVKSPVYFIIGAILSGLLSIWIVDYVQAKSKLKPDTILALTLSVFFGVGIVLLTKIQHSGNAAQSGLDSFLFGKAASMGIWDVQLFSIIAIINVICIALFLRGFSLISFDENYAKGLGFNISFLKAFLALLTVVTVAIGVQAVGVVLMAALLITPAAGARFLTNSIPKMLSFAGLFGFLSGIIGVVISYSGTGMPTGPWIVVVLSIFALTSILFGKKRGVFARMKLRKSNNVKINNENVLKDIYKLAEDGTKTISISDLVEKEKYPLNKVKGILNRLEKDDMIDQIRGLIILSDQGRIGAREVIRKHRLWEIYLSKYFQLDVDHVHDDAEGIEHVITPEIEKHLIKLLEHPETDPHQSKIPY
ncbi:metal ABC transporter permease [Bacteroidia bacterium]|nr:metal ABC transporter permease [Bacteroidia bacterium]MDB4107419.1 metal ABC transporter permease [Bacteroidia bacterium]MDB4264904.1 metal ABC transporter permease [bacterium]MDB9883259.1 metal ABC transporter permease [Bacteroidia bacterium]